MKAKICYIWNLLYTGWGKSRFTDVPMENNIINDTRINFHVLITVSLLLLHTVHKITHTYIYIWIAESNFMLLNIGIMAPCYVFPFLQRLTALKTTTWSYRLTFLGLEKFCQSVVHWISEIDICVIFRHMWSLPGALLSRELFRQTCTTDVPVQSCLVLAVIIFWKTEENTK